MKTTLLLVSLLAASFISNSQEKSNTRLPGKSQLAWHDMEYYMFVHFGPNTFTDKEWGDGNEAVQIFNPTAMDCKQWAEVAKAAGARGIIITAKHHDGFCLWPSKYSNHTVRESKWKDGKGDVLKELSDACRAAGLKFGVYLSPWDRNHPDYGTDKYNDVFVNMLKEILTSYGPIWELWWDGANGEGPTGKKQVYDWKRYESVVRQLSPNTVVFSDIGPDIRWVGNENGIAGITNWNYLNTDGFKRGLGAPPTDTLQQGNVNGQYWIPAECDVSIRPGWFYHAAEDQKVKTGEQLFSLYLKSVGRGANLLLNVPPDTRGLISDYDIASLKQFKKLRDENFADNLLKQANTYWEFENKSQPDTLRLRGFDNAPSAYGINVTNFNVILQQRTEINCIVLREAIHLGQTIRKFRIVCYDDRKIVKEINGTTVGRKRIITFPTTKMTSFKVFLDDVWGNDNISGVAAFRIDDSLIEQ
jgi:alpha-L-fucosidase